MLKKTIDRAGCTVEFDWFLEGSVLQGTVNAGTTECRTHFLIESPESDEDILTIIRLAKRGCFAESMVKRRCHCEHLRHQRQRKSCDSRMNRSVPRDATHPILWAASSVAVTVNGEDR